MKNIARNSKLEHRPTCSGTIESRANTEVDEFVKRLVVDKKPTAVTPFLFFGDASQRCQRSPPELRFEATPIGRVDLAWGHANVPFSVPPPFVWQVSQVLNRFVYRWYPTVFTAESRRQGRPDGGIQAESLGPGAYARWLGILRAGR